jgi:Iron-containing redox enzyme
MVPKLPTARGCTSDALFTILRQPPHEVPDVPVPVDDPLFGDDSALALYALYELHYRSFDDVSDGWEWQPSLLRVRAALEQRFLSSLTARVDCTPTAPDDVVAALRSIADDDGGPSLSSTMCARGTLEHLREFAIHRSAYQLKEADPHTWGIPRLHGRAKAALVDIQTGEYGDGNPVRVHATLFAQTLRALGLDSTYGAYLDRIPGVTLATVNLMSLFGLHRRWRGALIGHLALFEMCSLIPMGRYASAFRRLGVADGADFYDTHVEADARHERVALHQLAGALAVDEPGVASDIVFGARALAFVERVFASHLLDAWSAGAVSLRVAA